MNKEKVSNHIINWIKNYATSNNIKTLVVGISGGIDSSVVSTLCCMTGLKTILVEMPIRTNKNYVDTVPVSTRHLHSLQERFNNIQAEYVDLTNVFNVFKETLSHSLSQNPRFNLALANKASRERMITLYSFANVYEGIVVGTGNKVEDFGIGFFTIGGDGQVDISPIADLMKSEVYELGEYLGVIPEILNARPTDGLWDDGRTDEDQIGATYNELEWAMNFVESNWYSENGMENEGFLDYNFETNKSIIDEDNINLSDRQKEVLRIYLNRHNANKHKMNPIPICKLNGVK